MSGQGSNFNGSFRPPFGGMGQIPQNPGTAGLSDEQIQNLLQANRGGLNLGGQSNQPPFGAGMMGNPGQNMGQNPRLPMGGQDLMSQLGQMGGNIGQGLPHGQFGNSPLGVGGQGLGGPGNFSLPGQGSFGSPSMGGQGPFGGPSMGGQGQYGGPSAGGQGPFGGPSMGGQRQFGGPSMGGQGPFGGPSMGGMGRGSMNMGQNINPLLGGLGRGGMNAGGEGQMQLPAELMAGLQGMSVEDQRAALMAMQQDSEGRGAGRQGFPGVMDNQHPNMAGQQGMLFL